MRNENIKERMKIETITDRCMKARLRWFMWTRICVKTNTGDGTAREKKKRQKRKTKAETDRLREV